MIRILKISEQSKELVTELFTTPKIMKAKEWEACENVESIVQRAEEAMSSLRREMENDIEKQRLDATKKGYEDGFSQIIHELAQVRAERALMLAQAEVEALDLAFALARRIVGKALELNPNLVAGMVEEVAQSARGRRSVVIHIHPDDRPHLESQRSALAQTLEGAAIFFDEDATLNRGECVIETEVGRIDGRLETQLAILRNALEKSQ